LATLDLAQTGIVGVRPAQGSFNMPHAAILAPGDPYRSVLFCRMAQVGFGRMPRLGSSVADERGLRLIRQWIEQLPSRGETPPEAAARADEQAALKRLASPGTSAAERAAAIDRLLASTSAAMQLAQAIAEEAFPPTIRDEAIAKATSGPI